MRGAGEEKRWQAVAPGRVNLIGEHTDYNGLPVLPITIDRKIRVDFRVAGGAIVRLDSPSPHFAPFEFRLDHPIEAAAQGDWSNYVRAAARGLLEHGIELTRGIEGTVTGNVPIASGLSSSSALVVASALALLKANGAGVEEDQAPAPGLASGPASESTASRAGATISRLELAALMARAERFVGLEGGGMDQAACLHGVAGHALHIEFEPLRVTPVAVPEGWRWVVASSLKRAEKSAEAREAYNERARQCREALARVRAHGIEREETYAGLVAAHDLGALLEDAGRILAPVLFRRFRHVVKEGRRVALAEQAMRNGEMGRFGDLMVQSHESLRDNYEVSTAELDAMVEVALEAGAAGARLTGAGFGGCAVALCNGRTTRPVMEALAARFYAPRLGGPPGRDAMFAAKAAGRAYVHLLEPKLSRGPGD